MPRFFIPRAQIAEESLTILGDDARHIARSLRMAVGDPLTVSDGEGQEYECRLTFIRDERCDCEILSCRPSQNESPVRITLYMAYPKGDKLETVIQKAVELGAERIVPFESSRCIKRPPKEREEKIGARLSRIAEEAAKQCGRGRLPAVGAILSYREMLEAARQADLPLFCYEDERTRSIKQVLEEAKDVRTVAVAVGSEGGFSPEEADAAQKAGLIPVGLGRRILRCETAPDFALAALAYRFEL